MLRQFVRGWTLVSKELIEVIRQPLLVLSLVLGPFLILLVFALGHRSQQPPLTAVLTIPSDVNLSRDVGFWRNRFGGSVVIVAVTADDASARAAVQNNLVDLALIIPPGASTDLNNGKQPVVRVLNHQIDPVQEAYTGFVAYILSAELNKQIITEAAHQAQGDLGKSQQTLANLRQDLDSIPNIPSDRLARLKSDADQLSALSQHLQSISPGLVAAPFTSKVENVSSYDPGYVAYFSPGVLALLLQHMAITFAALSLVRDRLVGMTEIYTVAPTSAFGVLFGKYVSYALLSLAVGGALTALMTKLLAVPILGSPLVYWEILAALVFASLGVGLTISLLSSSQENAVQLTMLVLLASVFFSGFFLPVTGLQPPATQVNAALPVSYGIVALQDVMLRGGLASLRPLVALVGIGLLFLLLNIGLLRHQLRRR